MRGRARIAAGCAAVLVAAGSVGAIELRGSAAPAKPKLTRQQLGAKKLLAQYAQYGDCGCTGATRAKDRAKSGLATKVVQASGGSAASP